MQFGVVGLGVEGSSKETFVLLFFIVSYGILLTMGAYLLWRWGWLVPQEALLTQIREGRSASWSQVFMLFLIALTGLPPMGFFFAKLNLLVFLAQNGSGVLFVLSLLMLVFGWFVYFTGIRALTLTQAQVGFSRMTRVGAFNPCLALLLAVAILGLAGGVFFIEDLTLWAVWLGA
jgi:hypothetical protein